MMRLDGFQQIVGATVVQEEDALTQAPQRSGAKHIAGRQALGDVVSEPLAHVMDEHVGIRMDYETLQRFGFAPCRRDHRRRVAGEAADARVGGLGAEQLLTVDGAGAEGNGLRRVQETHEDGEHLPIGKFM
jgi:hypothetical protein